MHPHDLFQAKEEGRAWQAADDVDCDARRRALGRQLREPLGGSGRADDVADRLQYHRRLAALNCSDSELGLGAPSSPAGRLLLASNANSSMASCSTTTVQSSSSGSAESRQQLFLGEGREHPLIDADLVETKPRRTRPARTCARPRSRDPLPTEPRRSSSQTRLAACSKCRGSRSSHCCELRIRGAPPFYARSAAGNGHRHRLRPGSRPSSAWSTITAATTSVGTAGRPRPDGKQVREQLVGVQLVLVIGQERLHAAIRNELPAQGRCVQELTVGIAMSLHVWSVRSGGDRREHPRTNCSAVS